MKKLNSKGFTLIELLAVITILGILMLVAIPAISRTIENSRRDTFMDTAKLYVDAVRTSVSADEVECDTGQVDASGNKKYAVISGLTGPNFYIKFDSAGSYGTNDLMQSGGKSSWGNADAKGYVTIAKELGTNNIIRYTYGVAMVDTGKHGFTSAISVDSLHRADVKTSGADTLVEPSGVECKLGA